MPTVPIKQLGALGLVADIYPHELPPNAWSNCRNVRFRNGFVERILGEAEVFPGAVTPPYNLMQTQYLLEKFWLYAGLTAAGVVDSNGNHADITGPSGPYNATADQNWTMTNFQGIPIINSGFDLPQAWLPPLSLATNLADLPNWPAATFCRSMRAYRQFLVALDVTKPGDRYPLMVKWSHPAAVSAVPSSWDETDTSKDAGEYELADTHGYVVDGLPLRDVFIIYKEDSVWGMQYVGGSKVMRFFKIFDGIGILGSRCVAEFFTGKHLVMATDDIFIHDGQTRQSVLDNKMRRAFYSQANPDTFDRSFVVVNYNFQEVWCCAPTEDSELCNVALVWNWKDNTLTLRDIDQAAGGASGTIPVPASQTWDSDPNTWDSDLTVWDDRLYNPLSRRVFLALPDVTRILLADDSLQFQGTDFESFVERTGLGVPFRANEPPDTSSMKFCSALWPRIEGTNGESVTVTIGGQETVDGPVTWNDPMTFVIGTTTQMPCRVRGRTFALRVESATELDWRLHGVDLDVKPIGRF